MFGGLLVFCGLTSLALVNLQNSRLTSTVGSLTKFKSESLEQSDSRKSGMSLRNKIVSLGNHSVSEINSTISDLSWRIGGKDRKSGGNAAPMVTTEHPSSPMRLNPGIPSLPNAGYGGQDIVIV